MDLFKQIPTEVVEAAAKGGVREAFRQAGATEAEVEALLAQRMADTVNWPLSLAQARAAITAALAAWPDMEIDDSQYGGDFIIFPLTEADDEHEVMRKLGEAAADKEETNGND